MKSCNIYKASIINVSIINVLKTTKTSYKWSIRRLFATFYIHNNYSCEKLTLVHSFRWIYICKRIACVKNGVLKDPFSWKRFHILDKIIHTTKGFQVGVYYHFWKVGIRFRSYHHNSYRVLKMQEKIETIQRDASRLLLVWDVPKFYLRVWVGLTTKLSRWLITSLIHMTHNE